MSAAENKKVPGTKRRILEIFVGLVLAAFLVSSLSLVAPPLQKDPRIIGRINRKLSASNAEVLLLGNSMLSRNVDVEDLEKISEKKILSLPRPGTASAYWFTLVKNFVLRQANHPKTIVLLFRDTRLTDPAYRTTGKYFNHLFQIMDESDSLVERLALKSQMSPFTFNLYLHWPFYRKRDLLQDTFNAYVKRQISKLFSDDPRFTHTALRRVFKDSRLNQKLLTAAADRAEDYEIVGGNDFKHRVEESFLPHLLELGKKNGVRMVFVRVKKRRDVGKNEHPENLQNYLRDLEEYLTANNAVFLDFSLEPEILEEHYADGDHLNEKGRELFTKDLGLALKASLQD